MTVEESMTTSPAEKPFRRLLFRRLLRRALASRHLIWLAPLLAVLLCHQALDQGLQIDDYAHRAALVGVEGFEDFERPFWRLFSFAEGGADVQKAIEMGSWPWWSTDDLVLSFLRPVSGFSHWLDYQLWPHSPWAMHAHSLFWFALLVGATAVLYRQLDETPWVAGLAALLFAFDEAHAVPAAWIANRNALLAGFFGVLVLLAHHRWRQGWKPGVGWACVALLIALGANEGAVAVGAYLLAYALCFESGPLKGRWLSLLPTATLGAIWWIAYKWMGFGTRGSAVYIDPGTDPGRFVQAVWERIPWLLLGQWTALPADLPGLMSAETRQASWLAAIVCCALLASLLIGVCRRDRRARFWALGMGLSLLPICATFPSNRLLIFVGLGGMGLLSRAWFDVRNRLADPEGSNEWRFVRTMRHGLMGSWVAVHLLLSPWLLSGVIEQQKAFFSVFDQAVASLPEDQALVEQDLVLVSAPSSFIVGYGILRRASEGATLPRRLRLLTSSIHGVEVERLDARTLVLRPAGGLLLPPGSGRQMGLEVPPVDVRYFFQVLDLLFRDEEPPFQVGDEVQLKGLDIRVTEVIDGRPGAIRYRFDRPLDDPTLRWVAWQNGRFAPFELPDVGQQLTLPAMAPWAPR